MCRSGLETIVTPCEVSALATGLRDRLERALVEARNAAEAGARAALEAGRSITTSHART